MIVSQLLLTLFVFYWLKGQYKEEEKLLRSELNRGFETAEQMMVDSVLAVHLINPILNDSNRGEMQISITFDSVNNNNEHIRNTFVGSSDANEGIGKVKVLSFHQDSLNMNDTLIPHFRAMADTAQLFLYRGVRMFVDRVGKMDSTEFGRPSFIGTNADTLLFKKAFMEFMEKNNFDFSVTWLFEHKNVENVNNGIFLTSVFMGPSIAVNVEKYQIYLIRGLLQQILFAFFLLFITAASFRISYLNIKKHKKLLLIKNEFVSNITHELKTPVATVKVALEALLDFDMKKDPEVVQDYLEMSLLEMNRLDLLVSKVLNNSVLENGSELVSPIAEDLKLLIEEVIQSQQYRIQKNDASLGFTSDLLNTEAKVDKIHIQGVLLNLIDNSLKYAGNCVKIDLKLSHKSKNFIISVKDNGPGIPEEYLNKVFDKFFRVPTNDKHNVKGYGLGLNYAKLVMEHHNGNISVTNLPEGGCEFELLIPIVKS